MICNFDAIDPVSNLSLFEQVVPLVPYCFDLLLNNAFDDFEHSQLSELALFVHLSLAIEYSVFHLMLLLHLVAPNFAW